MIRIEATRETAGLRLDHFLAKELPRLSRSRLQHLIRDGAILLNASKARSSEKVRSRDVITIDEPPAVPTLNLPEAIPLDLLYEDADLLVLNKPAGMVVHPAVGNWAGTLVNALLHHCGTLSTIGGEERPGIVHRLDKETSGCLVVARNDAAHRELARQFAGREVEKIYLALAMGLVKRRHQLVEAPIGRHPVHRQKMSVVREQSGRDARTEITVLADLPCGSLLRCHLHTGRTHQIRVHLKHIGHPVLGDRTYGTAGKWPRQMLHAWQLGFTHPRTAKPLHFTSPIPPDFVQAGVDPALR